MAIQLINEFPHDEIDNKLNNIYEIYTIIDRNKAKWRHFVKYIILIQFILICKCYKIYWNLRIVFVILSSSIE